MRIILDWQHTGKPSSPRDVGAAHQGLTEVEVTGRYIGAARAALHRMGHEVFVLADGEYSARHARVNALKPALYVACHVNASDTSADYGAIFHWPGSPKGQAAADAIADVMRARWQPHPCRAIAATSGTWDRVRACLAAVQAPAVLLEPAFITGTLGYDMCESPDHIGQCIADGIHAWGGR